MKESQNTALGAILGVVVALVVITGLAGFVQPMQLQLISSRELASSQTPATVAPPQVEKRLTRENESAIEAPQAAAPASNISSSVDEPGTPRMVSEAAVSAGTIDPQSVFSPNVNQATIPFLTAGLVAFGVFIVIKRRLT